MRKVLNQIERLRELRGMSMTESMTRANLSSSAWGKWINGSSPQVHSLEQVARVLDADLVIDVLDRRAPRPRIPDGMSFEAIEIITIIDMLPEEQRERFVRAVHRMARTFGSK